MKVSLLILKEVTKPIRGTVALFVLLAGLAGLVFWFQDKAEGRFKVMSYEKRPVIHYGSMLLPTLLAGIVGIVCIFIAGRHGLRGGHGGLEMDV